MSSCSLLVDIRELDAAQCVACHRFCGSASRAVGTKLLWLSLMLMSSTGNITGIRIAQNAKADVAYLCSPLEVQQFAVKVLTQAVPVPLSSLRLPLDKRAPVIKPKL